MTDDIDSSTYLELKESLESCPVMMVPALGAVFLARGSITKVEAIELADFPGTMCNCMLTRG